MFEFLTMPLIMAITFILRSIPGFLGWTKSNSGDEIYHLLCAEIIRTNNFAYPKYLKQFLLPGIYDYPPLFHYLLAFFTKANREFISPYISAIIDVVHLNLILLYVFLFLDKNISTINLTAILFASSPALLYYGIGPRSYNATPRSLSELFITATFLNLMAYYITSNVIFILIVAFFSFLVLITNKFGSQVLVFFSICFFLLLSDPLLLIIPTGGFLLAALILRDRYINIFNGWIKHSQLFKEIIVYKHPRTKARNNFGEFNKFLRSIIDNNFKQSQIYLYNIINNNALMILLIRNILLITLLVICFFEFDRILTNNVYKYLFVWIIASVLVFAITSLRKFIFLGEAERYIEYSIPAQVILFSLLEPSYVIVILILIYNCLFYIFNSVLIKKIYKFKHSRNYDEIDLIKWLKLDNKSKSILTINVDPNFIAYNTNNSILWPPANFTEIDANLFEFLWEEIGWPNRNIKGIIKKYRIDLIIVNSKSLDYAIQNGWNYDLSPYKLLFSNNYYAVYDARSQNLNSCKISNDIIA